MNTALTRNGRQRVVVTGLGAVSPLGNDAASTWAGLAAGHSGVALITAFDTSYLATRIAASVKHLDATRYMDAKEARRMSAFIRYGVVASGEAIDAARLDLSAENPERVGIELGSALGGTGLIEDQALVLAHKGVRATNPLVLPVVIISSAPCVAAIRFGIKGPVNSQVTACATGIASVGAAARLLAWGEADVVLAGGTDSATHPLGIIGFGRLGALSTRNDTPEQASAPFDANRDGTVLGEGAAVMVLETLEHALKRDAPILAEILGYGLTSDAYNLAAPEPGGDGAAHAMRKAIAEAGIAPGELDWISAHGTGTQLNDLSETRGIKLVLGEQAYRVPVSSIKGAVGHMLGAAGALSAVASVQAMHANLIPPTLNYHTPDPECDLDYVPNVARPAAVRTVMVNAFGFGGQNAALVLRKWDGTENTA